jgi:hypothetical protein
VGLNLESVRRADNENTGTIKVVRLITLEAYTTDSCVEDDLNGDEKESKKKARRNRLIGRS